MAPRAAARDLSMKSALEAVESGNRTNGASGLDSLIQIFKHQSAASDLLKLDDKSYHRLFEAIFRFTLSEKEAFYRNKGSKAVTTSRLQRCAEALRLGVEHGAAKIKRKTFMAVIDHITDILPHSEDGLVPPLVSDYIKALAILLGHGANVELLATQDSSGWFTCVDFVLQIVARYVENSDDGSGLSRDSPAPSAGLSMTVTFTAHRSRTPSARNVNDRSRRGHLSDLMECLSSLTAAPNAPLLKRSKAIADITLHVLQLRQLGLSQLHQLAFAIMNALLVTTQTDDTAQANFLAIETLPLIIYWWQARTASKYDALLNAVQTEMLRILYNMQLQLEFLIRQNEQLVLLEDIEGLAETLWGEYSKRDDRAQLQQDDLAYLVGPHRANQFCIDSFSLRLFNTEGEKQWAVVQNLAVLEGLLWQNSRAPRPKPDKDEEPEQPRKRQRKDAGASRLRHKLRSIDQATQFTALQLLPFFVSNVAMEVDEIVDLLSILIGLVTNKNSRLSTWTMIACASLALKSNATDISLSALWKQTWQVAVRSVSMSGTCRAASFLLHSILTNGILTYSQVMTDISDIVTTADVNGPAVLVDSSLKLMTTLLRLRNHHLPNANHATNNHIVRWMLSRWYPADANFISYYSMHVSPLDIANIVRAACGDDLLSISPASQTISGPIAETLILMKERESIVRYLLLLEDDVVTSSPESKSKDSFSQTATKLMDSGSTHATAKLVAELFYAKLEEVGSLCDTWSKKVEGSMQITSERLQSAISCLISGTLILPQLKDVNTRQSQETEDVIFRILRDVLQAISSLPDNQFLYESILRCVRAYIPEMTAQGLSRLAKDHPHLLQLFAELSLSLSERSNKNVVQQDNDAMDIDDDFESQGSRSSISSNTTEFPRRESAVIIHGASFYNDTTQRIHLLQLLDDDNGLVGMIPESFVDSFLLLSDRNIVSCRCLVKEVFDSDLIINPDDAQKTIERVGGLIGGMLFSTCEVALNVCLDLMEGFIAIWCDEQCPLSSLVGDLYKHYLNSGLSKNLLSPKVQMSFSRLLLHLAQVDESFTASIKVDPPNTSLLSILDDGSLPVRFFIGSRLPNLFGRFVLKLHEDLFVNILDSLPTNNVFLEGIALRLFVLAEVARQWPTLLRRGIYHIFETPGKVPKSKEYASYCLKKIAVTLKLEGPRQLFDLFASQLLYTWLDDGTVQEIPYEIFGFSNLEELLARAQAEIVAIMVMRAQDDALASVAKTLGVSLSQLVRNNFSKTLAYSMAHDISTPKGEQNQSGESRLRKLLGREVFLENVYFHFADIVAHFVSLIDQEDPIERSWSKDENLTDAARIMETIKSLGHSDVVLGANQQPTFRPKYLTREIQLLCSRTEYEYPDLWNSALVVSVARKLFNSIHPALGPLFACSVLRKIRILICLADQCALKSYPLEMLLHSIRPYIVDTECADDALGLSQYLLQKGSEELSKSSAFLAGYSISTLTSLRVFLETSQSSTTQESQFKATMNKAHKFHSWFTRFLEKYPSSAFRDETNHFAFKAIAESAAHVRSSGNADRGTHESKLLLEILQDEARNSRLLSAASRKLALEMLCRQFTVPSPSSSDLVRTDEEAQIIAKAVWKSCQSQDLSDNYLAWAGRVIGRGFAASGYVDSDLLRESQFSRYCEGRLGDSTSEQGLLGLLYAMTADVDCGKAGLAESALRTIVSEAAAEEDTALLAACQKSVSEQLLEASNWVPYKIPPSDNEAVQEVKEDFVFSPESIQSPDWVQNVTVHLVQKAPDNVVLNALLPILNTVKGFAREAFPYVVHLILLIERKLQQAARRKLSSSLKFWFQSDSIVASDNISLLVNAILYLRAQPLPGETSIADRTQWLELDLSLAASAATRCGMPKTALLFIELSSSETARTSRRSSAVRAQEPTDLLLNIYENVDDPDAYYGLNQTSSLTNVLARLEYEKDGSKSLAFRGAQYDSHIRGRDSASIIDSQSLVGTLGSLGLSGLSNALLQNQQSLDNTSSAVESTFDTARKLETWNLPAPVSAHSPAVTIYKAYQAWSQANDLSMVRRVVWDGLSETMRNLLDQDIGAASLRNHLSALAVLTELNDTVDVLSAADLEELLLTFKKRVTWMQSGRYEDVHQILSCRNTTLSVLSQSASRHEMTKVNPPEARLVQVKSMLLSSGVHRYHQAFQESLNIATSLTHLVQSSADLGLNIDSAARIEAANSLWDHREMMPSIRMLQHIDEDTDLKKQTVAVSRSDLLAKTAYQISVAKLEKPDSIQKNYLQPALKDLKGKADGEEAGKVYHQFAVFCDEQLQNPDGLEDLARLQHLRQGKNDEVIQLKELLANAKDTQARGKFTSALNRARLWLGLDEQELRRVEQSRSEFVRLSLENYLLSLIASDEHNNDALRFTALWLERAGEDFTNEAVRKYIDKCPTRKFAPLMNQLTSRLLDQPNTFQRLLLELVYRICVDHPYHGMYQIWSGSKSKYKTEDEVARLRKQATEKVGKKLAHTEGTAYIWAAISGVSRAYHALAAEPGYKGGQKAPIKDSAACTTLASSLAKYRIPPPTMQIELLASRDYSKVPLITRLEPTMTIASGVSAPKIITAVGSNGECFKQLVKGGNDDLRQDAIMEQVFAAVSSVLKLHRSTRQRNLGIRIYKVLPLTPSSGLIEFVPNTIPLHDYLMPAHERYHPKDLKGSQCRKEISNVQTKSSETRLATYKKVADRFQPVMHYFFMEYFVDPDDWFAKRTAYTRTTAAISMLGHVLGLGDRHGHNILLDSKNGEVVHIDLGVAFESGRILPVPELVPFRMTRDIVDGMGITKTEGVFRRCCEFTLDALREETYSIMTILDVLRYDPLYSWSVSPVRIAKLQDTRRGETGDEDSEVDSKKKNHANGAAGGIVNEPSEADRALEVVRKKLSKTLSVTATVNDLINQATDERNLAVLYSGWAAYA